MIHIKDYQEKDHWVLTANAHLPSHRPNVIYDITGEELTSHLEYGIKNETQEEIKSTSSAHHVPRHRIVYNIFGQPHDLEIPSEERDHHWKEHSEEEWHEEPSHHECWDHEQHHEWHHRNWRGEEHQDWHQRQSHHEEWHPDVEWSHQEETSYEEEWFPHYLYQGDHHHSDCISSLETDFYNENENSHHQQEHRHHGKGKATL